MDSLLPLWRELQDGFTATIPILLRAAIVYLIIRFAIVVSAVVAKLGSMNTRPHPPAQAIDPNDPLASQLAAENLQNPEASEHRHALPPSTSPH